MRWRRASRASTSQTIAETKRLVDVASLPPDAEMQPGWDAFITSVQRPAAQARLKILVEKGLQRPTDVERQLGRFTAQYREADAVRVAGPVPFHSRASRSGLVPSLEIDNEDPRWSWTSHDRLGNTGKPDRLLARGVYRALLHVPRCRRRRSPLVSPKGGQPPIDPKSDDPASQTASMTRFKQDPATQGPGEHVAAVRRHSRTGSTRSSIPAATVRCGISSTTRSRSA